LAMNILKTFWGSIKRWDFADLTLVGGAPRLI
jgi:hypothetical protein